MYGQHYCINSECKALAMALQIILVNGASMLSTNVHTHTLVTVQLYNAISPVYI